MTAETISASTEDVERLAGFVGHDNISSVYADASSDGWNPFTDPRADLQVLERVREVWVGEWNGEAWHRGLLFGQALSRLQFSEYNANENGRHLGAHCEYRVGFYARAALAVLRESEEG